MKNQCKCGSLDFFIEKQGNNTGLYCLMCGKWQKWLNKDEIRLFEHNHKPKNKSRINQTNADKIRAMSDEELAELLEKIVSGNRDVIGINCGNSKCENWKCTECIGRWLQSKAEEELLWTENLQ